MSPSMTFKVKGCGKLSLAFHNMNRMAFAIRRHEIQIDNRAAYSVTTTIATGYGSTFKGLRVLKNGRMQQGNRCSDFRTFRVNYSGNTLLFEGCDLRNETLLRLSAPDLAMHQYMSAFSENQADWVFGVKDFCNNTIRPVTPLPPVPGKKDPSRSACGPNSASPACDNSSVNQPAKGGNTGWGDNPYKTTGPTTTSVPYPLVTGTVADDTVMSRPSTSSNFSSGNSTSATEQEEREKFKGGLEKISKALGSSCRSLTSFTFTNIILISCICSFAIYSL
ncbi:uncharacterized protein LOC124126097 [Haliotis rufescens]|uniref:uncharacterized protein LOC124126097 n=1 Tax=Haliotis rufescens TaxID=6454 RepID=UPI00201F9E53|nr:uncharacterized protein LOC124126097 [Haliotis rufescens]